MNPWRRSALLMLAALFLGGCSLMTIGTSPKGLEAPIEKAAIRYAADLQSGGYRAVSTAELKQWLDEGREFTIISALPASEERVYGAIPGSAAAPMPQSEQELNPEDREHLLEAAGRNRQQVLVVYSGFVACRRSHVGAKFLVESGYRNVYRFPAGIAAWGEAGYKLVKY